MTIPALRKLARPFDDVHVPVNVTQPFAHIWRNIEPMAYRYPDGSIGFHPDPAAIHDAWHSGCDYGLDCGTPLLAAAPGKVHSAAWDTTGFGNLVILDHGNGLFTGHAHQQALEVSAGQAISDRQVFGHVGSTGNSTGCHLHWFVCTTDPVNGYWLFIDPNPFLQFHTQAPQPPQPPPAPAGPQPPQTAGDALMILQRRVAGIDAAHPLDGVTALVQGIQKTWPSHFSK